MAKFSSHDLGDRFAVVDVQPFAAGNFQLARIETELRQDRGVDVGHVVAVLHSVKADFVGCSVNHAPFQARTRHPDGEAKDMMIASVRSL